MTIGNISDGVAVSITPRSRTRSALPPFDSRSIAARATDLAYSLQHEEAVALPRRAVELAPDNPTTHRSLASVLWLHMLYRRGAVTVIASFGSFSRSRVDMQKPPPEVDKEFRAHRR